MNVDTILSVVLLRDDISSITTLGDHSSRIRRKWNAELLPPSIYHNLFERISRENRRVYELGVPNGPLNERSFYFSRLILDFDFTGRTSERSEAMSQLSTLAKSVLRNHFNCDEPDVYITSNMKNNYHMHVDVFVANISVAKRFVSMLKAECYTNPFLKSVLTAYDDGPVKQRHIRMVLTDKPKRDGASVYTCEPPYKRFSIRPSEEQYREFIMFGRSLQCKSVISAFKPDADLEHTWNPIFLSKIFPEFSDESEESASEMSEEQRVEPHFLLAGESWFTATAACREHHSCHSYALVRIFGDNPDAIVWKFCEKNPRFRIFEIPIRQHYFDLRHMQDVPAVRFCASRESVQPKSLVDIPIETLCYRHGLSVNLADVSDERRVDMQYMQEHWSTAEMYVAFCEIEGITPQPVVFEREEKDGIRFSEQFMPHAQLVTGLNVEMIEASCGGGKTHYAIERLRFINRKTLVIAPREQLCYSLAERLRAEIPDAVVQVYKDRDLRADVQFYVCTVDSLHKHMCNLFGGYCFDAEVVLIDEIETVVEHCFYSDTLRDKNKRERCVNILSTAISHARAVLLMDRDMSVKSRLFTGWALMERFPEFAKNIRIREMTLRSSEQVHVVEFEKYTALVNSLHGALTEGRRVIVFETSCTAARAMYKYMLEEFPPCTDVECACRLAPLDPSTEGPEPQLCGKKRIALIAGDSDSVLKRRFSTDPDKYVHRERVDLLIHTSAVGVGISIDAPHFHDIYVVPRSHLDNRAIQQGVYRCRKPVGEEDGVRVYHMCRVGLSKSVSMLYRCPTLLTAFFDLKDRLILDKHAIKLYSGLPNVLSDGSMDLQLNGFNLLAAGMFMMRDMSLRLHDLIWKHEVYDFDIQVVLRTDSHDTELGKRLTACKRDIGPELEQEAGLTGTEHDIERQRKEALMENLGVVDPRFHNSNVFQFRAQHEMQQSNMERLHCYLAINAESPALGSQSDLARLEADQESLKSHIADSVFKEASYISMLLPASKFQSGAAVELDRDTLIPDPFTGERLGLCEFIKKNFSTKQRYRNVLYNLKKLKETEPGDEKEASRVQALVSKTIREFFGVRVVSGTAVNLEEINLSVAILPMWANKHQQPMSEAMKSYCRPHEGLWFPILEQEQAGTLDTKHISRSKRARH